MSPGRWCMQPPLLLSPALNSTLHTHERSNTKESWRNTHMRNVRVTYSLEVKLVSVLFNLGKIGNISHPGHFLIFIPHCKFTKLFYHTECRTCFNIAPSSTKSHSHVNCFSSFTRWLLPITPIPKDMFLHALVIVNPLTYHTSDKNPFILSHVYGGTSRMTRCLHAFIVNITPESEVLLKYHFYRYSPLFSS